MSLVLDIPPSPVDDLDAFHDILSTLAGALDIRDVFQRLSAIAARIVPHDEADLALMTDDGVHFRLFASTQVGEPKLVCAGEHCAVRDPFTPRIFHDSFGSDRGFHTGLRVPVTVGERPIGVLALLSRRPGVYSERDLTLASRLADYVAIGVSHRSEEHTSELQSLRHLVCRLLLEKKNHHHSSASYYPSATT